MGLKIKCLHIIGVLSILLLMSCSEDAGILEKETVLYEVEVLLPTNGLGDLSYIDALYQGVEKMANDFSISVAYHTPTTYLGGQDGLARLPQITYTEVPRILLVVGEEYKEIFNSLQGDFGCYKVICFDFIPDPYDNVTSLNFRLYAPAYVAGAVLGDYFPSYHTHSIVSNTQLLSDDALSGFSQGLEKANKALDSVYYLSNSYLGSQMADSAYALVNDEIIGSSLLLALGKSANKGMISALWQNNESRYIVGIFNSPDVYDLPFCAGYFGLDYYPKLSLLMEDFVAGDFGASNYWMTMQEGDVFFQPNSNFDILITEQLLQEAIDAELNHQID